MQPKSHLHMHVRMYISFYLFCNVKEHKKAHCIPVVRLDELSVPFMSRCVKLQENMCSSTSYTA